MQTPFTETLKQLRRELNHLYTEPFRAGDAGLFCREHALHLHGVASALGRRCEICTGCFGIRVPGQLTNVMTNSDGDHAWCRIEEIAPVDVSLTLRMWPVKRPDIALVYGSDPALLTGFEIQYAHRLSSEEIDRRLAEGSVDLLVYSENAVESRSAAALHAHPFSFLRPPANGGRTMQELLGDHIFAAITLHCLRLVRGEAKSIKYREQWSALRTIAERFPDAQDHLAREWSAGGST